MATWAAEKAPAAKDPVHADTVDAIKDVWRSRGEKPKNFNSFYRTYLRKRHDWALRDAEQARGAKREDKPRTAIAVGPDLDKAYE